MDNTELIQALQAIRDTISAMPAVDADFGRDPQETALDQIDSLINRLNTEQTFY